METGPVSFNEPDKHQLTFNFDTRVITSLFKSTKCSSIYFLKTIHNKEWKEQQNNETYTVSVYKLSTQSNWQNKKRKTAATPCINIENVPKANHSKYTLFFVNITFIKMKA